VYIAEPGDAAVQAVPLEALQHQVEVQHLVLHEQGGGEAVLASVDCYGRAVLAQMRRHGDTDDATEGQPSGLHITSVHQLQPADVLRWAQLRQKLHVVQQLETLRQ
jgi:hypothetical protein